jgi:uncharacterized protein (TIGR02246 family)
MRYSWNFVPIAVFSLTTSIACAQGVDQNTRQQIEQLIATYHDDWNKQDAAGIASLYTRDGVLVTSDVKAVKNGPQEIIEHYQNLFKRGITHHDSATVDQLLPLGNNALMSMGQYHLSGQGPNGPLKGDGYYTAVDVLDGGTWKIRMLTAVPNPPPTPIATKDLIGTWSLVSLTSQEPNGPIMTNDFGPQPQGRLDFDASGNYSLMVIANDLPKFASNNRVNGTASENEAVVKGSISHFGHYSVNGGDIDFKIEYSTFPNWNTTEQQRHFTISGDKLSYHFIPPGSKATVALVWQHMQ